MSPKKEKEILQEETAETEEMQEMEISERHDYEK